MIKMFTKKRRKGFTLIELIVVIAILGILAAIAIPRFSNIRYEAQIKAEGATATSIISAARVQEASTGKVVRSTADAATGDMVEIDNDYMILTAADKAKYALGGGGADLYTVTWTSTVKGYTTTAKVLTEGSEFNPVP